MPDPKSKWKPISTAPRDGTWFLAYWPDWDQFAANCTSTKRGLVLGGAPYFETRYTACPEFHPHAPTHWQPLPPPPEDV